MYVHACSYASWQRKALDTYNKGTREVVSKSVDEDQL